MNFINEHACMRMQACIHTHLTEKHACTQMHANIHIHTSNAYAQQHTYACRTTKIPHSYVHTHAHCIIICACMQSHSNHAPQIKTRVHIYKTCIMFSSKRAFRHAQTHAFITNLRSYIYIQHTYTKYN